MTPPRRKPRSFYLSMIYYGSTRTICSEHRTLEAAKRAAKACERRGGVKHFFWKVTPCK